MTFQDEGLIKERPSRVGAAVLVAARVALNLRPHWPVAMQIASALSVQDFAKIAERLLAVYDEATKSQSSQVYLVDASLLSQGQDCDEVTVTKVKRQRSPDAGYYSPMLF